MSTRNESMDEKIHIFNGLVKSTEKKLNQLKVHLSKESNAVNQNHEEVACECNGEQQLQQGVVGQAALFKEFNNACRERIQVIEQSCSPIAQDRLVLAYQEWVKDLEEQNELLLTNLEDIQRMSELQVQQLLGQVGKEEALSGAYRKRVQALEVESKHLKEEWQRCQVERKDMSQMLRSKGDVVHDLHLILNRLKTILTTGHWDFDDLQFRTLSEHQIAELRDHTRRRSLRRDNDWEEMQLALADRDQKGKKLEREMQQIWKIKDEQAKILIEKETEIKRLQSELMTLSDDISVKASHITRHLKCIQNLKLALAKKMTEPQTDTNLVEDVMNKVHHMEKEFQNVGKQVSRTRSVFHMKEQCAQTQEQLKMTRMKLHEAHSHGHRRDQKLEKCQEQVKTLTESLRRLMCKIDVSRCKCKVSPSKNAIKAEMKGLKMDLDKIWKKIMENRQSKEESRGDRPTTLAQLTARHERQKEEFARRMSALQKAKESLVTKMRHL